MTVDRPTAEDFVYMEARLADENRYDEWLALWTDDAIYWVPANVDDYDPHRHMSIIYDDRNRLQDRVDRLKSGAAWAQDPKSRMRRLISNIEIGPIAENGDIEVYSNFVLGELRREYSKKLQGMVLAEIDKDLTHHTTADIAKVLGTRGV